MTFLWPGSSNPGLRASKSDMNENPFWSCYSTEYYSDKAYFCTL